MLPFKRRAGARLRRERQRARASLTLRKAIRRGGWEVTHGTIQVAINNDAGSAAPPNDDEGQLTAPHIPPLPRTFGRTTLISGDNSCRFFRAPFDAVLNTSCTALSTCSQQ